ncbi:MAG: hypothetical protein Q9217_001319 [Psora testacea]
MNCQNCRKPLKLDITLQGLDPAAYELLVGRSWRFIDSENHMLKFLGSAGHSVDPPINTSRLPYAAERKGLYEKAARNASAPVFKRIIPAARQSFGTERAMAASMKAGLRENPAMSFMMLTDSEVMPARHSANLDETPQTEQSSVQGNVTAQQDYTISTLTLSNQIETSTKLFETLSSRSDIDHPVCTECTELLLTSLRSRLDTSTKERDAHIAFLKAVNNSAPTQAEVSKAQASLAASRAAEENTFAELQSLEREKAGLEDEIANLEAESLALDEEEEAFWRSRNTFAHKLSSLQNERDALNAAYDHDVRQLEKLQRTNVYNDALHITSDGTFATINGLRLGRLPPKHSVDWAEINAAWGYAALLVATVADKLGFAFRGYRVKPMGSISRIEQEEYPSPQNSTSRTRQLSSSQDKRPKVTTLDLYSSGDMPLASAIIHRRINHGMVAFLECLRQLCEFVEKSNDHAPSSSSPITGVGKDAASPGLGMKLPYRIKHDKIGNDEKGFKSIRLNASNDDEWTDACKYTLTCCKYLLAAMGHRLDARD